MSAGKILYVTLWHKVFLEKSVVTQLIKKYPKFMELKGSMSCLQNSIIGLCTGVVECIPSPSHLVYLHKIYFNIIVPYFPWFP